MGAVRRAQISSEPLDVAAHLAEVESARVGAVASFIGTVRDHDPDAASPVVALEYSAHPDAAATLHDLALRAIGSTGAVVAVSHRIGRLAVGDAAVVIAVGTAHRAEAFEICRELIEEIKRELPVWKRQVEADGHTEWKGIGG